MMLHNHTLINYNFPSPAVQAGTLDHVVLRIYPEKFIRGVIYDETVRPKQIGIGYYIPGSPVHCCWFDFWLGAPVRPEHSPIKQGKGQ